MPAEIPDADLQLLLRTLEQALEEAGALTGSEPSDLSGKFGRAIMDAYARGVRDPKELKKAAIDSLGS